MTKDGVLYFALIVNAIFQIFVLSSLVFNIWLNCIVFFRDIDQFDQANIATAVQCMVVLARIKYTFIYSVLGS